MDKFPTLSNKEAFILSYLTHNEQGDGPVMVKASAGLLMQRTVHDTLQEMTDKGYLHALDEEKEEDASDSPKKIYKITREGAALYNVWRRMVMKITLLPIGD